MNKISLKTNTILIFVVCMISISGCSDISAESMDIPYDTVKVTDEGNISLKTVKEGSDYKEPDRNEAKEPAVSAFTKELKEDGEPAIYDEAHGFYVDMSDEEPEGLDEYEIDEDPPLYRVDVRKINVMSDVYNDLNNCNLLRLALQNYLDLTVEEPGAYYSVELVDGSCNDGDVMTFDAVIDELPGITLHIEYDKNAKQFGIDSDMMDASLNALRKSR